MKIPEDLSVVLKRKHRRLSKALRDLAVVVRQQGLTLRLYSLRVAALEQRSLGAPPTMSRASQRGCQVTANTTDVARFPSAPKKNAKPRNNA